MAVCEIGYWTPYSHHLMILQRGFHLKVMFEFSEKQLLFQFIQYYLLLLLPDWFCWSLSRWCCFSLLILLICTEHGTCIEGTHYQLQLSWIVFWLEKLLPTGLTFCKFCVLVNVFKCMFWFIAKGLDWNPRLRHHLNVSFAFQLVS